jgi:hypothetical protein
MVGASWLHTARADLAYTRFGGGERPGWLGGGRYTGFEDIGVRVSALRFLGEGDLRPYLLGGLGLHKLRVIDFERDPNTPPSLHVGFGVASRRSSVQLFAEVGAEVILSDYGNDDFSPSRHFPIRVGVRF